MRTHIRHAMSESDSVPNVPLDWNDIKTSAARFALKYKDAVKESSDKQSFWTDFMKIFGIEARQVGAFEYYVKKLGVEPGEIDYFWPGKVLIEHKSAGKNLDEAMDQAMGYLTGLEDKREWPRYIIVSDFKRIRLQDLEPPCHEKEIKLSELADNIELFGFLAGYNNKIIKGQHPVNIKAAEAMGNLYDMLKASNYPEDDLNLLLIRLVFCMFAEDADIFEKNKFSEYVFSRVGEDGSGMGATLTDVFTVLNTKPENRQTTMSSSLASFPYVDGGLFEKQIQSPQFNREMKDCLLKASQLDWRYISPAIFGSLFQSIMDPELRRELGAHYTSEENILKAIDALFMDDLRAEFEKVKHNKKELRKFWDKLKNIRILDPACGCGNFLIISYREMRRLEMDVLDELYGSQMIFDESHLYIDHYYGIEIEEFASMVASLSIILIDHLMNIEMRNRFGRSRDIIPLREKANIVCGNSLRMDWNSVIDASKLTYIVGNPPFVGSKLQTPEQRKEVSAFFSKNAGILDYVSAWYVKAAGMMLANPNIRTAFVSTNSITQGEQVEPLWKPLFNEGFRINFAYRTFKWSNEARGNAAVHVVIIGFSLQDVKCRIYDVDEKSGKVSFNNASHINAYLVDGPDIFIINRSKPICDVPEIGIGNKPIDGGNYLFTEEEKNEFIKKEPAAEKYFRPWIGSKEFINGYCRYCLWLGDCTPSELRSMPECMKRVEAVREFRLKSTTEQTRKLAETPTRFHVENMPTSTYVLIPKVSSERRRYVPMGFMTPNVLSSDLVFIISGATLYHFGILTSNMHMVWMRYVCGRLKSDYRYSAGIVYNNFPWPIPTDDMKRKIEECAKHVLDVRKNYPGQSLADLYDPLTMPPDLLEAHHKLDAMVEKAYRGKPFKNDDERISYLFEQYSKIVSE